MNFLRGSPSLPRVIIDKDVTTVVNVKKVGQTARRMRTSALPLKADICAVQNGMSALPRKRTTVGAIMCLEAMPSSRARG